MVEKRSITGLSLDASAFRVADVDALAVGEVIAPIMRGKLLGARVQGYVDPQSCLMIRDNFLSSGRLVARLDEVPGLHVGAYHYGKTTREYLDEVRESREAVNLLFANTEPVVDQLKTALREALQNDGITLRAARGEAGEGGAVRALWWTGTGAYLLAPHDDMAQLHDPRQSDFEIQQVGRYVVVAVNLYPVISGGGGELEIWNVKPDDEARRIFGVESTGYPYPETALVGISSLTVDIGPGDLVMFDGGFVHAARGYAREQAERLLLTLFLGLISPTCAVWWT